MSYSARVLRTFFAVAHKNHYCDYCTAAPEIFPGDEYRGEIVVSHDWIMTRKQHVFPPCPPGPHEMDDNKINRSPLPLALAA